MPDQPAPRFSGYAYGGARALVQLHDRHLRSFVAVWKQAFEEGVPLPPTDDPTCQSLEAMLRHVLGAARSYMTWMCERLGLDDPGIDRVPEDVAQDPDAYLGHVLARWDGPLRSLDAETAEKGVYPSRWGTEYCIDAMLEHAVMHPLRHEFQLERARAASPVA